MSLVIKRPWGRFERLTINARTTVKLIYLKAGGRLSWQYHNHRSEFWRVIAGKVRAIANKKTRILSPGDSFSAPMKAKHRLEGLKDSVILEIARGKFSEKDVIRLSDDYGRHQSATS